jgi:rubredoxin/GNAT superfamily N-acetyltransferase
MLKIRIAEQQDIGPCARLLGVLFGQEQEFKADLHTQEEGLRLIIENPSAGTLFVCELDGAVVGMVSLLTTISTALGRKTALLEDMIVSPEFRGKGIGSRLIQYACDWAREHGLARITLLTDGDNLPAHRFYTEKGFSRSDMVVFRKMIEPAEARPPAWMCIECGYVYDPSEGEPDWNVCPGTAFADLPEEWSCPVCNASREQFRIFDSHFNFQ